VAFERALALGADGLELDVRLSRDGLVVVHHDPTLERTTNLQGELKAHTAAELAGADAGFHFRRRDGGRPFRGLGIGIPSLAEILAASGDARVIVELKVNSLELAEGVVRDVRAAGAQDRVCVGAFARRALGAVRSSAPEIATSAAREEVRWALYRSWCRWPVTNVRYGGYQVPEIAGTTRLVSPRFIEASRRAGLGVQVWTVDAEDDARRLLEWGVDALITDRPDIIVPVVRLHGARAASGPA
jgi:glycerophosphoryl diester phosphodiesterase